MIIDAGKSEGTGKLTLSGEQNQAMVESVRSCRQWLIERSDVFGLKAGWERSTDLHVHVGNVDEPKGGGSAALAIVAALASAMTGRKVRSGLALTGALALGDEVRPVGEVIEKLIGASRAGVKQVHVPQGNQQEVESEGAPPGVKVIYAASATETVIKVLAKRPVVNQSPRRRQNHQTVTVAEPPEEKTHDKGNSTWRQTHRRRN